MCLRNGGFISVTHLAHWSGRRYQIMSPLHVVAYLHFFSYFCPEKSWNIMIHFASLLYQKQRDANGCELLGLVQD